MFVLGLKRQLKKEQWIKKIITVAFVCPLSFMCFKLNPQMVIRGGTFQEG